LVTPGDSYQPLPARPVFAQSRSPRAEAGGLAATFRHACSAPALGHDFSEVRVHADDWPATRINDQTPTEGNASGEPAPAAQPAQTDSSGGAAAHDPNMPVIDSVELVTSSAGAVGGYRAVEVMCDASLNNPGPFNDIWAKGSIANVLQVQFHVSHGSPTDVRAARVVNRTATSAGKSWTKAGDDSPPPHEYEFTNDKMVVADAPGWCNEMLDKDFPVTYQGDFGVWAYDPLTKNILASIAYHVEISKTNYGQIDAVNTVAVTDKKIGGSVASPYKPKPKGP
jgi:hypothetical protein